MRRLLPLLSLLLVVLWLPATQHCALQVTGLIPTTCPDEQSSCATENAAVDGCDTVENGSYKQTTPSLKAPGPDLAARVCFLCDQIALLDATLEPGLFPVGAIDRPLEWVVTWHFTRRAALPVRAPTFPSV